MERVRMTGSERVGDLPEVAQLVSNSLLFPPKPVHSNMLIIGVLTDSVGFFFISFFLSPSGLDRRPLRDGERVPEFFGNSAQGDL